MKFFAQQNEFKNFVSNLFACLFRPQCFRKSLLKWRQWKGSLTFAHCVCLRAYFQLISTYIFRMIIHMTIINIMSHFPAPQSLQWPRNGRDGVSNHQPHHCLLNRLFRQSSKKTSKLRVTGLCVRNSPVTGEFPAQISSNAKNVSIWWRHHDGHNNC